MKQPTEARDTRSKADLLAENEILRNICKNLHWKSRRYCDGRGTYATREHNADTKLLLQLGVSLTPTADGTLFAKDMMGRAFDGLTAEEAAMGDPLEMWRYSYLTEGYEEMG